LILKDFKELKIWQRSHQLALKLYKVTKFFPKEEIYGLTSQIRRACISIPANISEGCGRYSETELARFFQIAMGSASELEYHLLIAHDLGYLNDLDYEELNQELIEVKKMLAAFIKKLKADR
jgi:four helix bundle protein